MQFLRECQTSKKQILKASKRQAWVKITSAYAVIKIVWVSGVVILNKDKWLGATHIETKYRVSS